MSHEIRNRALDLIEAHAAALSATGTPESRKDAQTLRQFIADHQKLHFEAAFMRLRAKEDEIAEGDRLTLRFGADWS